MFFSFFFFNDTATTEIYTLSLHDALPISFGPWFSIFLRSSSPPSVVFSALRAKINELNPEIRSDFSVFRKDIEDRLIRERMMALLSGFFGALAGLLTMIGLYGVISYIVVTRQNEIGK